MKRLSMDAESIAGIRAHLKCRTSRVVVPQPHGEDLQPFTGDALRDYLVRHCPYSVGETVAITETFCSLDGTLGIVLDHQARIVYKQELDTAGIKLPDGLRWQSSRFMRPEFARLRARITSIDVGRVQSMTYEQIVAEGYRPWMRPLEDGLMAFAWWPARWDGINAKKGYPYSMNPWVYGYGFEVVQAPVGRPVAREEGE